MGAIPRLTQIVEGSYLVNPEGSQVAEFRWKGGLYRNLYFSEMERARNAITGQKLLSTCKGPPGRPRVVEVLFPVCREPW